ncbi:hypothetical protein B0H17DRAFT_1219150 [Mycena rosella]|uniref:Uncharacterized protein n=1 Tax=Mycena rosella TaxID=1033263 RepID=A0AAD7BJ94_MYCRO|nr:hypothetical protein B0H17DRAFT_1219150 [Mycena rosella]
MKHPSLSPGQPILIAAHASRVVEVRTAASRSAEAHSSLRSNTHRACPCTRQANRARTFRNGHCRLGFDSTCEERGQITIIGDDVEADLGGSPLELGLWRVHGALLLSPYFLAL